MNNVSPQLNLIFGKFYLQEDLKYYIEEGKYVSIKKGYSTNFGSIPPIGRCFISPIDPDCVEGFLLHDFLVQENVSTKDILYGNVPAVMSDDPLIAPDFVNWAQASALLRKVLINNKCPAWKRRVIYIGTRLYGIYKRKK